MGYSFLADLLVVLHMAFVLFVLFGGLLTVKWPRALWLHLPAVAWGALVEFTGWFCPLSSYEYSLRMQGGESADQGDFVSRWFLPVLYPDFLTPRIQVAFGGLILVMNVTIYAWIWRRRLNNPPT
ncbi:MAG TPA: DUF2784 domain-containing protein [Nitrospira sp.]|jgi:hypothetical protein|nr:DUF2784 domain-containing protein [Nitrospira sp.]